MQEKQPADKARPRCCVCGSEALLLPRDCPGCDRPVCRQCEGHIVGCGDFDDYWSYR